MNKDFKVTIRLDINEHKHLNALAHQSHLNISDYIRYRLFEENISSVFNLSLTDENLEKLPTVDFKYYKELMKLSVHIFTLVKELGRNSLPQDKYENSLNLANLTLEEWGYNE